jgi:hypothetical protein
MINNVITYSNTSDTEPVQSSSTSDTLRTDNSNANVLKSLCSSLIIFTAAKQARSTDTIICIWVGLLAPKLVIINYLLITQDIIYSKRLKLKNSFAFDSLLKRCLSWLKFLWFCSESPGNYRDNSLNRPRPLVFNSLPMYHPFWRCTGRITEKASLKKLQIKNTNTNLTHPSPYHTQVMKRR